MKTHRFKEKLKGIVTAISVAVLFSSFAYARILNSAKILSVYQSFYFLVSNEDVSVSTSLHTAYLNGGAGYLLERAGEDYSVYACYLSLSEAESAKKNITDKKQSAEIYEERVTQIYLKSKKQKICERAIKGYIQTLYSCISLIGRYTVSCEKGGYTQTELYDLLQDLFRVLERLAKENTSTVFKKASDGIVQSVEECRRRINELIYAKDLRFFGAELADLYLSFLSNFKL